MMDRNDIDAALFEIEQMTFVAIGAQESLMGSDADRTVFQMPERDANTLSFAIFDLQKRVELLRAGISRHSCPPELCERPAACPSFV